MPAERNRMKKKGLEEMCQLPGEDSYYMKFDLEPIVQNLVT